MNEWDEIVHEHGPAVFTTAWRILGDADETEAVVEDVFAQGREMGLAQEISCWQALLRRLAVCRALDRLRWRQTTLKRLRDPAGRLRAALSYLPAREAGVFALRYFEDLSTEKIADTLLLGESAVKMALAQACRRLEALMRPTSDESTGAPGAA